MVRTISSVRSNEPDTSTMIGAGGRWEGTLGGVTLSQGTLRSYGDWDGSCQDGRRTGATSFEFGVAPSFRGRAFPMPKTLNEKAETVAEPCLSLKVTTPSSATCASKFSFSQK